MDLRQLRLGVRLGIGIGLIVGLFAISQLVSGVLNERSRVLTVAVLKSVNDKALHIADMKSALYEVGIAIRNMGLHSDEVAMKKELERVQVSHKRYADAKALLLSTELTSDDKAVLVEISRLEAEIQEPLKKAIGHAIALDVTGAAKEIAEKFDPLSQAGISEMNRLVKAQDATANATIEAISSKAESLTRMFGVIGVFTIGFACFVGWLLTRSITHPLSEALKVARQVASGQLSIEAKVEKKDEISELLHALHEMTASLSAIVRDVRNGTEAITVASAEIAAGNTELSTRTEAQAASLEETASTMEEFTATVRQNAENAQHANEAASCASQNAEKGGEVVKHVVATMASIKESSKRIVDITGVIDSIAFQTNILALNAAVEAARAGEQGRGFAVVASEVRSLAQRSANAAKEIKLLIDDSVEKVDDGSRLVNEAGATMDRIVRSIKDLASIMGDITAASLEQSNGIDEVGHAIRRMDDMTQQNTALVEQAAAAAHSMKEQALTLKQTVKAFRLEDDKPATGATRVPAAVAPYKVIRHKLDLASPMREAHVSPDRTPLKRNDEEWEIF